MSACSDNNQAYIDRIKEQVKENASGVELNYKNLEFKWVDTLTVKEKIDLLSNTRGEYLKDIKSIELTIRDFDYGKVFSKEYLTKAKLLGLRNWERNIRKEESSEPDRDYYEFAEANKSKSEWLQNLTTQLEETDKLLSNYESITFEDTKLFTNVLWYYKRIDKYYGNTSNKTIWDQVTLRLDSISKMQEELTQLTNSNPEDVIYLKAYNKYSIVNPLLNNATVEIKRHYFFNQAGEIIKSEEIE